MMDIDLSEVEISFDETYHLYRGNPLYNKKFKKVMSFHPPGMIAAVEDESGAYHINLLGEPLYAVRYKKTYGFYEGIATVVDEKGYFHIDVTSKPIHTRRFSWAGNFQEGRCVVRDFDENYFHITRDGNEVYKQRYAYVGDYKYGIAVVYDYDGYATHIDRKGLLIHGKKYLELGVYHKGFAIARDGIGYFHVDKSGNELYKYRFAWVENFYNNYALARTFDGRIVVISTKGNIVKEVAGNNTMPVIDINRKMFMKKLVGYWHTQILYSIVKTGILEYLAESNLGKKELKRKAELPLCSLNLIIDYLLVNNMIRYSKDNGKFEITSVGKLFTEKSSKRLKYAALMWGEEHYVTMAHLIEVLKKGDTIFRDLYGKPFFEYLRQYPEKNIIYQKAMEEYSIDYDDIIQSLDLPKHIKTIADIGGGSGLLLQKIISRNPHITKGILFDLLSVAESLKGRFVNSKIEVMSGNFLKNIPLKVDAIIMSRVLHDWDDENLLKILSNVKDALNENGLLYAIETIVPEEAEYDCGNTLNFNLLVMVGGKERRLSEFKMLFDRARLVIEDVISIDHCNPSVIILKKRGD